MSRRSENTGTPLPGNKFTSTIVAMAVKKTKKSKKNPHYGFLVSWSPEASKMTSVKGESKTETKSHLGSIRLRKNADSLAKEETRLNVKKDIIRSLITISLILILELVVYLAWIKFIK